MKNSNYSPALQSPDDPKASHSVISHSIATAVLSLLLTVWQAQAASFPDDFNDGDDTSPAWTHVDPLGMILGPPGAGTYTFPGGNTYRFGHAPSLDLNYGTARMSSLVDGLYSSNSFYASVDVLTFDFIGSPTPALQAFGLYVHGSDVFPGTTKGIAFIYENLLPVGPPYSDHITITRVINEQLGYLSGNLSTNDGAAYNGESSAYLLTLSPAAANRLVLIGSGTRYEGRVYQLPDLTKPIALCTATNTAELYAGGQYTNGVVGITAFNYAGAGGMFTGPVGVTWDNYYFDNSAPTGTAPSLAINTVAGTNIVTWPGEIPGIWELETSPELGDSAVWTTIPLWQIKYDGGTGNRSHIAPPGTSGYFRLRKL